MPKPSANAIPLPRRSQHSLVTSKRQANDLPRKEDPFIPGFTWEEFHTVKLDCNVAQVKLDLTRENQIWHYLGKNSTDAKAQFTEDPAQPRHNPKGHFLDTIPKPAPVASSRHSYPASYPSSGVNQHGANASKSNSRPSLPHSNSRTEKPYEYKPRGITDNYRVDPQAWRSQQNFVQKSALPYSFGSDPSYSSDRRWPATDDRGSMLYTSHRPSAPYIPPPLNFMGSTSSSNPRPPPGAHIPSKSINPFSNPSTSSHNNNGRSSIGGRYHSKPNPFAKYPYLQKQHNRSPLEYKSPYSQGGGFMNGYEGDLKEHLRRNPDALFRTQRSSSLSSTLTPNPLLSYNSGQRQSYSPSLPYPRPPESSTTQNHRPSGMPSYTGAALASIYGSGQSQATQAGGQASPSPRVNNMAAANVWERKDPASLHPAIRQEYGNMFHHQYQPPVPSNQSSQHALGTRPPTHQPSMIAQSRQASDVSQPSLPLVASQNPQPEPSISNISTNSFQPHQPQQALQYENKPALYAHQQYFQNAQNQSKPQTQPPSLTREVPDVPADSTSLIEKLMTNLREASRQS